MDHMRYAVANAKYQAEKQRKEQMERQKAAQAGGPAAGGGPAAPKPAAAKPEIDAGMTSMFNSMDEEDVPMVKLGDASIAAPFTSKSKKLTAICDIVRLGRCTLVTTLQMYKILALNCLVASYTMAVLFSDGVKFSQSQMVSSGLVMTVCFLLLSRSTPLPTLSPQRPITRVFHPYMMVSIFGQFAVHLYSLSQSVALVQGADPSGVANQEGDEETDFNPSLLNSIVFLMTTLMSVTTFAVNFKGRPFMTGLLESRAMMIMLGGLTLVVLVCASEVDPEFNELFEIKKFPSEAFRNELLWLLAIDAVGSWAVETVSFAVLGRL
jgi:cation-transporting ATPase 13A1